MDTDTYGIEPKTNPGAVADGAEGAEGTEDLGPTPEDAGYAEDVELTDEELVARALECYQIGIDTTSEWRRNAMEDLEFIAGEQWDQAVKGQRDAQGRPALTVNRLPQFVQQLTNEQRQSKPSVTVNPVDSGSDKKTAEVLQGVIRNIEYTSNADSAYAAGGASAAITGLGYWDVAAEYEDERSFKQKLTIRRVLNPMNVVMDPGAKELAGDDARWVMISTDISSSEWKSLYPDKEMPKGAGGYKGQGDAPADWVAKDGVRIHEYRYISEAKDTLFDLGGAPQELLAALHSAGVDASSGTVLASEVGPSFAAQLVDAKFETRETTRRKACWAKIAANEVVERGELAGRYLQLVRVVGTERSINGKVVYEGIIRHAKDTQRALNYFVSAESEAIALAPKAPWLMAEGQDEGYEEEWRTANQRPLSRLKYKPTTLAGQPVPKPERVMAEANISAITQARMQAADDLKAVTGIYDAELGARSNEQSGRAILARQTQGQTTNFHYQDNFSMAIRYTGRILIDLIPHFYSEPQVIRILGDDGEHEMVPINGAQGQFRGEPAVKGGAPIIQFNSGRYDVAVSMGPSYLSRRQEASAQLMELVKANPVIGQMAPDLIVANMDIPGGDAIVDRLRKALPPNIRPPDDNQPPPQVLAQQLQQSQAMIQQMTEKLHQLSEVIESKEQENASKERIAYIQAQTELVKVSAQINSKEKVAMFDRTAELIHKRLDVLGEIAAAREMKPALPPNGAKPGGANGS